MNYVDFSARAADAQTFWALLLQSGLAVTDEGSTNEAVGVNVHQLPPIPQLSSGALVNWPEVHFNVRVDARVFPAFAATLGSWVYNGALVTAHTAEYAVDKSGVTIIENISSPASVWA